LRESVLNDGIDVSRRNARRKVRMHDDDLPAERRGGLLSGLFARLLRRPGHSLVVVSLCVLTGGIFVNALFLQSQRHPAPFFAKSLIAARLAQSAKEAKAADAAKQARVARQMELAKAAKRASEETAATEARRIMQQRQSVPGTATDGGDRASASRVRTASYRRAMDEVAKGQKPEGETVRKPGPARDLIGSLIRSDGASIPRPPRDIPASGKAPTNNSSSSHGRTAAATAEKQRIASMQRALVKLGYTLTVDGIAGPATKAALEKFQRKNRLPASGKPGDRTLQVLASRARVEIP
jgi:hypothetical protein